METNQGIPGILEIDRATGTICFHADPRYFNGPLTILKITNLPDGILEPIRSTINIDLSDRSISLQAVTPVHPAEDNHQLMMPNSHHQPNSHPVPLVQPGCYVDVLYPAAIIGIMGDVLAGCWEGPDPEMAIDHTIRAWVDTNITDPAGYIVAIARAARERGCLDIVLARLNAELVSEPDTGNTIKIMRRRRYLLPGESPGIVADGHPLYGLRQLSPPPDDGPYGQLAEEFYGDEINQQLHQPRPTLTQESKLAIWGYLTERGCQLIADQRSAFRKLEDLLHKRDLEQSIIARLCYLAIISRLRNVDSRLALEQILTQHTLQLDSRGTPQRLSGG